jgi:predicted amidohydrolase YtcJ
MDFDEHADLILHGGKLTTMDEANPVANAPAGRRGSIPLWASPARAA